jgi:hypothetical protein
MASAAGETESAWSLLGLSVRMVMKSASFGAAYTRATAAAHRQGWPGRPFNMLGSFDFMAWMEFLDLWANLLNFHPRPADESFESQEGGLPCVF